jgi:hypothetical protein
MKQIQPVNIWIDGEIKTGINFSVICVNDNYESQATNYWQIYDIENISISQGNLTISGQDYIDWGNVPANSINTWIYNWSAQQLNLVIIP